MPQDPAEYLQPQWFPYESGSRRRRRLQPLADRGDGDGHSSPRSASGEGDVFSHSPIEVMSDHHHVEGLIKRICSVWSRWSRRSWNNVWFAADPDNVRCMPSTGPFRVKSVNGSSLESRDCILDETALVERVCMDKNLHIHVIRNRQTTVNGRGRRTPVFVELEAACPGLDLLNETSCRARIALTEKAEVHGEGIGRLEHPLNMPRTWSTGGRAGSD